MTMRIALLLLLLTTVAVGADQPSPADSTSVPVTLTWLPFDSVQKAFPAAPKPLFLYISQKGCDHCDYMDSAVFGRPEMARFVNENFTPVRVDVYLNTPLKVRDSLLDETAFRKLLSIQGIPAYYFFDTAGRVIGVLDSQMDLLTFKRMLVYIRDGHFFRTPWVQFMDLPAASEEAIDKLF